MSAQHRLAGGFEFAKALEQEDYPLPAETVSVDLIFEADAAVMIRFTCNVTEYDLEMIGRAFLRMAGKLT